MAGDLKVSNGSSYVATKTVAVSNGSSYVTAKGVYVSNGAGGWTLSWPNLSTAAITGPAWVMSTASGQNPVSAATNTIKPAVFSITLSNPTAVVTAALQMSYAGGVWTQYGSWNSPGASFTHTQPFTTNGSWSVRVVITHANGTQVISNAHPITCYKKSLTIYANGSTAPIAPADGSTVTFTPACSDDCAPVQSAQSWWYTTNGSPWTLYSTGAGSTTWPNIAGNEHWWLYREDFADGSIIHSQYVSVDPYTAPRTEVYLVNGDAAAIQNALNDAANNGLPTRFGGSFSGSTGVRIPAGARVSCDAGTAFYGIQFFNGYPAAGVPDGGYRRAGNIVWTGGTFDMQSVRSTAFSISHCPSFQLHGATIYNTTNVGHGIEINSSGGAAVGGDVRNMAEWQFTIQVVGCRFGGMQAAPRTNLNDEAMHMDYAWGDSATAAGTVNDGTSCHNVLFKSNRVERMNSSFYNYTVGVGNHKTTGTAPEVDMGSNHGPIRIHGNVFVACGPFSGSDQHRGSVDLRGIRNVQVVGNTFSISATAFGINAQTGAGGVPQGYIYVHDNSFESCGHWQDRNGTNYSISRAWTDTNTDPTNNPNSEHVYIYNNTFTGWVGANQGAASDGGQYLVCNDDVDTLQITGNRFWGLTGNGSYTAQTSNRIYGSTAAPPASVSGYLCSDNTWSPNANGAGAVIANS